MKTFKLLPRLFVAFGFVLMFAVSGWGASNSPTVNLVCPITSIAEGNLSATNVVCNITLDVAPDSKEITVTLSADGASTANTTDYSLSSTSFSFPKNTTTTSLPVTIMINGDTEYEPNETLKLNISAVTTNPQTKTNGTMTKTITIVNDDPDYTVTDKTRSFSKAFSTNDNGNIQMIGNSVLWEQDGTGGKCAAADTRNNNVTLDNMDKDSNTTTFNSSSAVLTLPKGVTSADIKYTALYWQGRLTYNTGLTNTTQVQARTAKIQLPGYTSYQTVSSIPEKFNWFKNSGNGDDYQGVADITDYLKHSIDSIPSTTITNSGYSQTIWVADILTRTGASNLYGGWSIVVVYHDGTKAFKNLVVYDGFKKVAGTNTTTDTVPITLSGFLTPSAGDVNAEFFVFGGEGDYNSGDSTSLTKLNADGTYSDVPLKSGGEVFDSSITDSNGNNVTTRNEACSNTLGIDSHSFKIGNNVTPAIIQNKQTTTTVKLSSFKGTYADYDTHYPGMFAFSTDLYAPDLCYEEKIYDSTGNDISGVGQQVTADENLTVKVLLVNRDNETAQKVQIIQTFDDRFPYVSNSSTVNNNNPANILASTTSVGDSNVDNDLLFYDPTTKKYKINLGIGANATDGGSFLDNNQTKALFTFKGQVKSLDSNFSNTYQAVYKTALLDYSQNPVILDSCDGSKNSFYGYSAPVSASGDFNVVYAANADATLTSGYKYNLPTAIASRADNYKVIALNTGTDILKDLNTTVAVELVDASSGTCSTYTPISDVKTWIPFHNASVANFSAADIINGVILADPQAAVKFYKNAGKNVKFRISYPNDGSGGTVVMEETVANKYHLVNFPSYAGNTCVYPVTATTYNPSNGNVQGTSTYTQVPQACGNAGGSGASAMTQHEVNVCLECIYGANVNYVCSKDNFAIRPEAFYVKLYDYNQTNIAIKQAIANNIAGPTSLNLASGYNYYAEVNATNHFDNNATDGYDATESLDAIWEPRSVPLPLTGACNDDTNKSAALNFGIGQATTSLSVDQVGEYRLNITDSTWAEVDSNSSLMSHHVSPYFMTAAGSDCILDSSVTRAVGLIGLNGCNISTGHVNNVAGLTYMDHNLNVNPYKFDISTYRIWCRNKSNSDSVRWKWFCIHIRYE